MKLVNHNDKDKDKDKGKIKGLAMPDELFAYYSKMNIASLPSIDERSLSEYSIGTFWHSQTLYLPQ